MMPIHHPLVAQLDNAADSDSEERGFESLQAGQKSTCERKCFIVNFFDIKRIAY